MCRHIWPHLYSMPTNGGHRQRGSPRPTAILTSSLKQYTPVRPKSAASEIGLETLTCLLTSNITGDEWTSKCPPTTVRMSLPDGSKSWGMERWSPEQESTLMSQNMWSSYTSQQTTHSDQPPPYLSGSWS